MNLTFFRNRVLVWMLLAVLLCSFVPSASIAQQPTATTSDAKMIADIQLLLQQLGYDPDPIDGIMGKKTRAAIRAFQRDHNLYVDGETSEALVEALKQAKRRHDQEKEQPTAQPDLTTMFPNELYVRAVQFEIQGNLEDALKYYNYLMETYPDHDLAVKAADRATVLSTSTPQPTPTPTPQPTPTPKPREKRRSSLGIYGAISSPRGDFGDDSGEDAGFAKRGFGGGIEFTYPLGTPGLSVVVNVSGLLNGFDEDEIEYEGVDVDAGFWINIPVMAGLKYEREVSPTMKLYGVGQAGINVIKGPNITLEERESYYYGDYYYKEEITFDVGTSLGFGIGGGIVINERLNIGLRYLSLGEPEVEVTSEWREENYWDDEGKDEYDWDQPVSILFLTVGINF